MSKLPRGLLAENTLNRSSKALDLPISRNYLTSWTRSDQITLSSPATSNTLALLISDFGKGLKRKDTIVTTQYFDPPHIAIGVEVAKVSVTKF